VVTVTLTYLRRHAAEVVDRAIAGEHVTITRYGRPVAEMRPVGRTADRGTDLADRRPRLPAMDPDRLRRDIDEIVDPRL
jgi:antitoxin (DNA-binding transcriptional repressor) of toxin-antitoxin stability system